MLIKSVITILASVAIINAVIAYACCVAAGRADDVVKELEAKKYGTFGSEE